MDKKILIVTSTGVIRGGEYVLGNDVSNSKLKDKIVLMGPSAPIIADYFRSLPVTFIPCKFLNSASALKTGNPMNFLKKMLKYVLFLFPFFNAILKYHPSVVIGNINGDIIYSLYAKIMRKKFILGIHEEVVVKSLLGRMISFLDRYVDKYIAVSKCVAEQVALCSTDSSKVVVVYNGIKQPVNVAAKPLNPLLRLLFIGDLEENKNPLQALEIASQISNYRQVEQLRFIYKNAVRDMINKLRMFADDKSISVEFLNAPPRAEIDSIIRRSDFLIVSSQREAFSLVTLEAISLGTPVIAKDIGGLPEIIKDKENGFLYSENKIPEICRDIAHISNEYYLRLSNSGLKTASQFTHSKRVEEIDNILNLMS